MLTTRDLIQLLAAKYHARTVYALAKAWNKPEPSVRRWWKGHGAFGQAEALEVAELLGLPPELVLACVEAERAPPEARRYWESIAEHFKASAAALLAAGIFLFAVAVPELARADVTQFRGHTIDYAKYDSRRIRRRRRFWTRTRANRQSPRFRIASRFAGISAQRATA